VRFESEPFRNALSCALELLGANPLVEQRDEHGSPVWVFPPLDRRAETDPSWAATLDTLRAPRRPDQTLAEWRRDAPIRPVIFEDAGVLTEETVHLHLEQRVAQRLLARFRSQGFVYHDLSRACLAHASDAIPRVILLGRLSLYGRAAERLHEDIVSVAARWTDPVQRTEFLTAYARDAETRTLELLDEALSGHALRMPDATIRTRLLAAAGRDVAELQPLLKARADALAEGAIEKLADRGSREEKELRDTLEGQRERVRTELARHERDLEQLTFDFDDNEKRELQANMDAWRRRLQQFDRDLALEPQRIRDFYDVHQARIEPVGLVYLWPESN
jgi:hypothetical protein